MRSPPSPPPPCSATGAAVSPLVSQWVEATDVLGAPGLVSDPDPAKAPVGVDTSFAGATARAPGAVRSQPSHRPVGRHHEPGPLRVHRPGEPLVRSLLRDLPRGRRDPDGRERRSHRVLSRSGASRRLSQALPRHQLHRSGRPARHRRLDHRHQRRQDGRVRDGAAQHRERLHEASAGAAVPGGDERTAGPARRHGLPHGRRDPDLLEVRRDASRCTTGCSRRPTRGRCPRTCS